MAKRKLMRVANINKTGISKGKLPLHLQSQIRTALMKRNLKNRI